MWFLSPGKVMFEEKWSSGKAHKAKKKNCHRERTMKIISVCKLEPFTLLRGVFAWVLLLFLATSFQTNYRDLSVISIFLEENKVCFFPQRKLLLSLLQGGQFCRWIAAAGAMLSLPLGGTALVHSCPWPYPSCSAPAAWPGLPHCREKIV